MSYWSDLQTHQYVSGSDAPLLKSFRNASLTVAKAARNTQAGLLYVGNSSDEQTMAYFLGRLGVASGQHQLVTLGSSPNAAQVASAYQNFANDELVYLSNSALPFITDSDTTNPGINTSQVRDGAWLLMANGNDGNEDPLQGRPRYYQDGIKAAAALQKIHFYYGLNASLTGRDADANGCRHIKDYCIGAPHSFRVVLRDNSRVNLTGEAATFAYAAYLLAWERMPVRSHVSALFDLAESCVDGDIGVTGTDDATGLGRLDIGCLAYGVSQVTACPSGQILTSTGCQPVVCPVGTAVDAVTARCEPIVCEPDELLIGSDLRAQEWCARPAIASMKAPTPASR